MQKIAGSGAPNFEAIAFLEYASPKSFLKFAIFGDYDSNARSAGLKGQWLLASTTLEESDNKSLVGVAIVWEGSADSQAMGYATKTPSMIVVTQLPSYPVS